MADLLVTGILLLIIGAAGCLYMESKEERR